MRDICTVEGCDDFVKGQGYCSRHYQRFRKYGDPTAGLYQHRGPECSVRNCSAPVIARGWCDKHYKRWQVHGDPLAYKAATRNNEPCSVEGCDTPYIARGLCGTHYARWQKHGDPNILTSRRRPDRMWTAKDGYVYRYFPEHPNTGQRGRIAQHVVVMSEKLGRPLHKGETVHHVNGIKDDNRPENLELWMSAHPKGQRVSELIAWAHELLERYADDMQLWPEHLRP